MILWWKISPLKSRILTGKIGGIVMLSTTNIEQLFGLACGGNIKALEDYWNGEGDLNVTYERFGKEHSLIMGAFSDKILMYIILKKNNQVLE